jgi:hypothetical protein
MKVNGVVVGTVDYAHGGSPIAWHGAGVLYRSTYDIHAS